MVQRSKKTQIAEAALPLFLEHGIKGTSVDMVVRASGVSKPTVYNHFPDKSRLMLHVVELWLSNQPVPSFRAKTLKGLQNECHRLWLNAEALRLYGLFAGERFRVTDAAELFIAHYDTPWRDALKLKAESADLDGRLMDQYASHLILSHLLTAG